MKKIFHIIFILFLFSIGSLAQIVHEKGSPFGINIDIKSLYWFDPGFTQVEINDIRNQAKNSKEYLQFAISRETAFKPGNFGIITQQDNNLSTWHMLITSKDAASIGVIFSSFELNEGERVFIYDPEMSNILGPFTSNNNKPGGVLPVVPLPGSQLIIEFQFRKDNPGDLELGQVSHDVLGIFGEPSQKDIDFGSSGPCNVDINCPEGDDWSNEKRAVVKLLINNLYLGSGTLVNNTAHQNIAYVLTAAHVVGSSFEADRTIAMFNYESPWCDGPDGSVSKSISSSNLVSVNEETDAALIKLSEFPPILYKPYMAGWDVTGTIPLNQTCIHHPSGDVKKYSYDADSPIISTYEDKLTDGFWKILQWDIGTTEGGSSGSPLFDPNHRIIGTLTGGEARCGNSVNDYFSRLDISYDISGSGLENLKQWLDINSTGATVVNGRDPYDNNYAQSDTLFNGVENEFFLTEYTGGLTGMTCGFNSDSILAYSEKFSVPSPMEITDVFLYVGRSNYVSSEDSVTIFILDDIGGPGNILATQSILINETKDDFILRVDFSQPVNVDGTFYVGYRNWYAETADSEPRQFAVFHGSTSLPGSDFAWFKDNTGWYPFNLHPFDPGENTLYIKVVAVETSTIVSIESEKILIELINLYPNPFDKYLVLELVDKSVLIESATILDLSGRVLRNFNKINSHKITIDDLHSLNSGLYLLNLRIAGRDQVYKIIKE